MIGAQERCRFRLAASPFGERMRRIDAEESGERPRSERLADGLRPLGEERAILVAEGAAEAMLEGTISPWDIAALQVIVEEAGGRLTDGGGARTIDAGYSITSSAAIHETLLAALRARGERAERVKYGVDDDVCNGDPACIRLSGCPSLTVKDNPDKLRQDPVATVVESCVGCGLCGEVSHAAILCPSFYKTEVVHNPGLLECAALFSTLENAFGEAEDFYSHARSLHSGAARRTAR